MGTSNVSTTFKETAVNSPQPGSDRDDHFRFSNRCWGNAVRFGLPS